MLEALQNHVVQGMNEKLKDLRKDFYSKNEFKNDLMKVATKSEIEQLRKELDGQLKNQKKKIEQFGKTENDFNSNF